MIQKKVKLTTIAIERTNYEALRYFGHTGESFNTVIKRLIQSAKTKGSQANVLTEGGTGE